MLVEGSRTKARGLSEEDLYIAYTGSSRDYYLTQFEIIKSREFAERLVRVMGLTRHPEFDGSQAPRPWYAALMPASGGAASSPSKAPLSKAAEDEALTGSSTRSWGGRPCSPCAIRSW